MRGRKPKPTNLKLITGTQRPDRENVDEPKPPITIPDAPDHLQDEEIDVFIDIAGKLARMRVMTEMDVDAVAFYAVRFVVWKEAMSVVRETGLLAKAKNGSPIQNPYLGIANKAQADCMKILIEFGLTPSSRTRIKVQ